MEHLTANQITLLLAAVGLVSGSIGWLGRGLSFLLVRWWTGTPKQEQATYLNTVADLGAKLRSHGMSIDEVRQLSDAVQNPSIESSAAANTVVEQLSADADASEPDAFQTNAAMKMRTSAAYEVAEAELNQALMDLRLLVGEHEWECVQKAQEHWRAYRRALEEWTLRQWEGGTGAGLAAGLVGMAETERRADEIRAQVEQRASR
ncbi:MAG TPA: lysozyme inhibitor LprI family protein [Sphingomicrobium sp.]|nr:lysozyme inhibitor LprI family protein [Sphingomicrobium sp.]